MSVLRGANNTVISGGQFNATANVTNNIGPQHDVLAALLSHSATAGLLNANERFDAPICDENTRVATIQEMKKWVKTGGSSSAMLWFHGPAGAGKSALAQSLALLLQDERDHAASFFFSRTAPGRNNGTLLVATLAYQLARNYPPVQAYIAKGITEDPAIFTFSSKVQMERLIVEPVNQLRRSWRYRLRKLDFFHDWNRPRLILIDGLDECDNPEVQRDIIAVLGSSAQQLRLPFRFIIASRPESHILSKFELDQIFQGPNKINFSQRNLGDDRNADEDIATYLDNAFAEIRRTHPLRGYLPDVWPQPEEISQLVLKSSRGFIYPATVIRYIKSPQQRPEDCLKRILGLSTIPSYDKPYKPLDDLYHHIFASIPEINKESVQRIFELLVIPRTSDDELGEFTTPAFIEKLLFFPLGHVEHVLGDLLCLVAIVDRNTAVKVLHASLTDFLFDSKRSQHLHVDIGQAHESVARGYHKLISIKIDTLDEAPHAEPSLTLLYLTGFVNHSKKAFLSPELVQDLAAFDLGRVYDSLFLRESQCIVDFTQYCHSIDDFFGLFQRQEFEHALEILSHHIAAFEEYITERVPAAYAVYDLRSEIIPAITFPTPTFQQNINYDSYRLHNGNDIKMEGAHTVKLLMIVALCSSSEDFVDINLSSNLKHAYLIEIYLESLPIQLNNHRSYLVPLIVDLLTVSLDRAHYTSSLMSVLDNFYDKQQFFSKMNGSEVRKVVAAVANYLHRIESDVPLYQLKRLQARWKLSHKDAIRP